MNFVTSIESLSGVYILYKLCFEKKSVRVAVLPNFDTKPIEKIFSHYTENPKKLLKKVEFVECDLTKITDVNNVFDGVSRVYHTPEFLSFWKKDLQEIKKNIEISTKNVVNYCIDSSVENFCYVSSALVFESKNNIVSEDNIWDSYEGKSIYSAIRYHAELEVFRGVSEGLNAFVLNPTFVIGNGFWYNDNVNFFSLLRNIKFYKKNTFTNVVYAMDVAELAVRLMDYKVSGENFILSSDNILFEDISCIFHERLSLMIPKKLSPFRRKYLPYKESLLNYTRGKIPVMTRDFINQISKREEYCNDKILNKIDGFSFINSRELFEQICDNFGK